MKRLTAKEEEIMILIAIPEIFMGEETFLLQASDNRRKGIEMRFRLLVIFK